MLNIGHNLKMQMKLKKLSSYELSQKAGLSKYQVENVMYNRSTKPEVIYHLAQALDIPLEKLMSEEMQETQINDDSEDIDCEMFAEIFDLISKVTKNNAMKINSKKFLFKIAEKFYAYLKENKENKNPDNSKKNKEEVLKGMFIALQND